MGIREGNDGMTALEVYRARVIAAIDAETMRQRSLRTGEFWHDAMMWGATPTGSVGVARSWLDELLMEHPEESPSDIAAWLAGRVEHEIGQRPNWFTVAHLRGVAAIADDVARQMCEEAEPLVEIGGLVSRLWERLGMSR